MSAEFGRSGGAVMNVTIKSGTNNFHGSVYEFLRNSKLDAKNYFDPPDNPIPPFKLNQFGSAIGGPIKVPDYDGKNRTFFFVDYQGTRIRTGQTFLATVAPPAWKNRRFQRLQYNLRSQHHDDRRRYCSTTGISRQQDPRPAASIRDIQINPVDAQAECSRLGFIRGCCSKLSEKPDGAEQHESGRCPHRPQDIGQRQIFARFSMSDQSLTPPSPIPPPLSGAAFSSGDWANRSYNGVFSETHIFSPRIVNEFRAG